MNLERAYILLAIFYSLLLVIGVIAVLFGGGTPLSAIHLAVGALAVVGLWGYMLHRGFLSPRLWQPFACLLAVGVAVQLFVILTGSVTGETLIWMLTSSIFAALLVAILYRYGDRDQSLWASADELEAARRLDAMLANEKQLTAVSRDGSRENSVKVEMNGDKYQASVMRRSPDGQESFEERFRHPATLVFFLEKFTGVTVRDLKHSQSSGAGGASA
ncbi:hypothetical protein R5M92_08430 [Halomonas sp. Bachu 37]|uniref:hypothetical protein n=1 Tax=Halomonas kashgarensis TaxID=3084920 RepID=UPI003216E049